MDKKSIIGIAVVALLFFGFAYFNTQEQKKYQDFGLQSLTQVQ